MELLLITLLTLVAGGIGTVTGFGTSTIMVPILLAIYPLPETLFFVGIIHWFGDVWKMWFFRSSVQVQLILAFGVTGIIASYLGARIVFALPEHLLSKWLGGFLIAYVLFLLANPRFALPQSTLSAGTGGALSGFFAGIFGVGGAIRGAFLSAFNLPKEVYISTSGAIALFIDSSRVATYWVNGVQLSPSLLWGFLLFIPASFLGAGVGKRVVDRIPQEYFRYVIACFLFLVGIKFLVFSK